MKSQKAFTLIELLVVIAIIGLLSSVVLASINVARARARDTQRLTMLKQVQNALELYASSNNGTYPAAGNLRKNSCDPTGTHTNEAMGDWTVLNTLVTQKFIPSLPRDPRNTGYAASNSLCFQYTNYNVTPNSSYWHTMSCGGRKIGDYQYALLFSTEASNLNLPTFGASLGSGYSGFSSQGNITWDTYKYCLLGPER